MAAFIEKLKNEPALVIGGLFGALLAAFQYLSGHDLIGSGVYDVLSRALDPEHGWALPIVVGIVTRFFVFSPKSAAALRDALPPDYVEPTVG